MSREEYCAETPKDLTLCGEVWRIHNWIRRVNKVLGIGENDESVAPKPTTITDQVEECVTYLNDPLGVGLEVILSELHKLKKLVG